MAALKRLPVSVYAPLRNISPLFLVLLTWLLLGETLGTVQLLGLLLIVLGAVALDIDPRTRQWARLRLFLRQPAVLLMLPYGLVLSFVPILDRLILRETIPATTLFYSTLIVSLIFWAIHYAREGEQPFRGLTTRELWWFALTGILMLITDLALFMAISIPGTVLVVLIGVRRLSTLFSTLMSGAIFQEERILYKSGVCLVMILGTLFLIL